MQHEPQHRRGWELGLLPKPAVDGVVGSGDAARDSIHHASVGVAPGRNAPGVFAALAQDIVALLIELRLAFRIGPTHFVQHGQELVRRQVGRSCHEAAVWSQERGGRPAAHVVAGVDVRTVVSVNAHRREVSVDEFNDVAVCVGAGIHLVAPVAPHRVDRKQDGTVVVLGEFKGLVTPWQPGDGISRC